MLDASELKAENSNMPTRSVIAKAPWPPMYVLETAASILRAQVPAGSPRGLVLMTNVNCGYLDMAANLLLSVRKTTDAKVRAVEIARRYFAKRAFACLFVCLSCVIDPSVDGKQFKLKPATQFHICAVCRC